jgi:hypothetical protein
MQLEQKKTKTFLTMNMPESKKAELKAYLDMVEEYV